MHNSGTGSAKTDKLLADILSEIRKLQPHRSRLRRALVWILVAFAAPVVGAVAVPGAHQAFARAACYVKYLVPPHEAHPAAAMWQSYGVTSVKAESSTNVAISPTGPSDIWYGAVMPITRYCDYSISFSAELIGPLMSGLSVPLGYGYGIGVRGSAVNGVPNATTVQYDPPFGGLRIVPIPCCANQAGYNPQPFPDVVSGRFHRWTLKVIGAKAYISFDGKGYNSMSLSNGDDFLVRVWNAELIIKDIFINRISPWG
jgi:hypothetical protein